MANFNSWAKTSVTLKLVFIGFIIVLLLIPTLLVDDLIRERRNLRDEAQDEIASKFGREQTFGGPVISVPYTYTQSTPGANGPVITSKSGYAHFLPEELEIDGDLTPEERSRGIFVAVLYNTRFTVRGHFNGFNSAALAIPEDALRWEDAIFTVGISDMRGVDADIDLTLADTTYSLGPGPITTDVFESGANTPVRLAGNEKRVEFSFALNLNGSSGLYFRPFGARTDVTLRSSWPDPSFGGGFLPQDSEVTPDGFVVNWEILQLNRNYPQQGAGKYLPTVRSYVNRGYDFDNDNGDQDSDRFGVRLLLPVDEYSKIYRSTNYAVLFIIITFLTFFFIEVLNRRRVHPIQYILIGAAIILFYVLLLSISEHKYFDFAYGISALAITGLITMYSYGVLRNVKLTALVAAELIILYIFFYSLLQLQDYALLIGSLGLLLILGTIMFLTRNIDWYNLTAADVEEEARPRVPGE